MFHQLSVAACERLTDDAVAVTFDVPADLADAFVFTAGQHLAIRSDHGAAGSRRSYSIASPVGGPLRIGIKQLPGGAFSTWAVSQLKPGDTLEVMTPSGKFGTAGRTGGRRIVCLAAGSGITPVFSVIATALATEPDTEVVLLYGTRTTTDTMFAEELADLKDAYPERFAMLHFLSREPQTSPLRSGRLDADKINRLWGTVLSADVDDWYLCGPQAGVEEWREALLAAGVPARNIHRELFHAGPALPAPRVDAPSGAGKLTFTLDGRTSEVDLGPADTLLDAVLRVRPDAPFACRGGVCGTCRATVLDGKVDMDANFALEGDELERGFVLTCQARPNTGSVCVDFDR
jgi:ring-1,2-phenylacetyl-CoA epoxidase subunit PaaE